MGNKLLDELKWRGILNNVTSEEKLTYAINNHKGAYIGFDPSAISLHLGNYAQIMLLRWFSKFGLKAVALIGGATGMIGDPSGKLSERVLLDISIVNKNKKAIAEQLTRYAKVEHIFDNYDHYKNMGFLDFLRDIGKYINVNYLLEKEVIKQRLETGISYTEFTYSLIQGYDFVKLYKENDIYVQAGGSDQWGNITTGCEMIRKMVTDENNACGITLNLLLNSDGKKFGKSEKGAIYLDPNLTSPYKMYQFLINQEDSVVINLLKFLTEIDRPEIMELEESLKNDPRLKLAQKKLAETIMIDVHGKDIYEQSLKISQALFNDQIISLNSNEFEQVFNTIPNITLSKKIYTLVEFLVQTEIAKSNREARELIDNNSITINGEKLNDQSIQISEKNVIHQKYTVIKKGKRNYFIVLWVL